MAQEEFICLRDIPEEHRVPFFNFMKGQIVHLNENGEVMYYRSNYDIFKASIPKGLKKGIKINQVVPYYDGVYLFTPNPPSDIKKIRNIYINQSESVFGDALPVLYVEKYPDRTLQLNCIVLKYYRRQPPEIFKLYQ